MMIQDLLNQRRGTLLESIRVSAGVVLHTDAWLLRVLHRATAQTILTPDRIVVLAGAGDSSYEGFPRVAALGYALGMAEALPAALSQAFVDGIGRLQQRSEAAQAQLARDEVALLGIADGLARITAASGNDVSGARTWLLRLINETPPASHWSGRMWALAGDLLDQRGRLRVVPEQTTPDILALELVLRAVWPQVFATIPLPSHQASALLHSLVIDPLPDDPERSAAWLRCLDLLVNDACIALTHSVSDTARILRSVQHALKRWPYEDKPHRTGIAPIRWIIDDEYDVQTLLWAVLYPIYRETLVDETYLPNWGNKQPRADLGITTLKLIIEVKIARQPGGFTDIEEQVAGDLGLYFKDLNLYDRMVVFVYDDCDKYHPEKYDSLRNALMHRERIEDVIIVRRPGMLPNRGDR